jgi:hypothetical protein
MKPTNILTQNQATHQKNVTKQPKEQPSGSKGASKFSYKNISLTEAFGPGTFPTPQQMPSTALNPGFNSQLPKTVHKPTPIRAPQQFAHPGHPNQGFVPQARLNKFSGFSPPFVPI